MKVFYESEYDFFLSVVCIVRNEEKNIYEWIEYHRLKGIDHFYIYDNGNSKELEILLRPYVQQKIVEIINFPGEGVQLAVYRHAIDHFAMNSKYMAFIDADEFIYTRGKDLLTYISDITRNARKTLQYMNYLPGGIGINWKMFGTAGYLDRSYDLVTVTHNRCTRDEYIDNGHIKTIANPRCVLKPFAHHMVYFSIFQTVSPMGSICVGPFFPDGTRETGIRLYHYVYKSEEEIREKYLRGDVFAKVSDAEILRRIDYSVWENREHCNENYDDNMLQYESVLRSGVCSIKNGGVKKYSVNDFCKVKE